MKFVYSILLAALVLFNSQVVMAGEPPVMDEAMMAQMEEMKKLSSPSDAHKVYRSEWKVLGADSNTYTAFSIGPEGNEYKGMEIIYTRV